MTTNGNGAQQRITFKLLPRRVDADSEIWLVRPGIADEKARDWQHIINASDGQVGALLMHGHLNNCSCEDQPHWKVTGSSCSQLPECHLDEHSDDPHLLRHMLRVARDEIVRLRNEQQAAVAKSLDEFLNQGPVMQVRVAGDGQTPTRTHPGDAGFDLYVSRSIEVPPQTFVDVHCDVSVQLPRDMWGMIIGRSSTLRQRGLLVPLGVIDQGYRGELYAGCWNLTDESVLVAKGERIAQFIPIPLLSDQLTVKQVLQLDEHARGESGFGSSGQ